MNKQIDRQTVMVMMMIHVMHQQLQVTTAMSGDNSNVRWMQRCLDGNDSRTVEVLC